MYESANYPEPWQIHVADTLQVDRLLRFMQRHSAIIVAYHGVIPDRDWQDWETSDMVAESVFRQHLAFYRKNYHVMPLRKMVAGLDGSEKLPPYALSITFDDGYRNNLKYAIPALKELQLTATFFLTTGFIDGTDDLWWLPVKRYVIISQQAGSTCRIADLGVFAAGDRDEAGRSYQKILAKLKELPAQERSRIVNILRNGLPEASQVLNDVYAPLNWSDVRHMVASGMEVGAHTVAHTILANEPDESVRREIHDSVECIRSAVGIDAVAFSYPDGQPENCRESIKSEVKRANCYTGLMNFSGFNRKGDDLFQLCRFPIGGHHTSVRLKLDLSGLRALKNV